MCHCQSNRLIQTLDTLDFVTTNYSKQLSSLESLLERTQSQLVHEQTENAELREAVLVLLEAVEKCNGVFGGWPHCKMKVTGGHLADPVVPIPNNVQSATMPRELHAHLPSVVAVLHEQLASERESHQQTKVYVAQLETKLARREAELKLACSDDADLTREGPSTYHWDEKLRTLGIENVLGSPLELTTALQEPQYESSDDEVTLAWAGSSSQPMQPSTPRSRHTPRQRKTYTRGRHLDDDSSEQSWDESFTREPRHPLLTPTTSNFTQLTDNGRHSVPFRIAAQPSPLSHPPFPPSPVKHGSPRNDSPWRYTPRKPRTKIQALLTVKQRIDLIAGELQEVRDSTLRLTATASGLFQNSISLSDIGSSSSFDHLSYLEDQAPVRGAADDNENHWGEIHRDAFHREASLDERADSVISMELCSPLPQASDGLVPLFTRHHFPPTSAESSPTIRPSIPRSILATLDSQDKPISSLASGIISPLSLSGPLESSTARPSPPFPRSPQPKSSISTDTERGGSAEDDTQEPLPIPPPVPSTWYAA